MKRFILALALAALPSISAADGLTEQGLDDPEVTPPAAVSGDWTGFYVGAEAYRETTTSEGQRCFKLGQPKDCNDPIFDYYPEYKVVETFSLKSTLQNSGAFVGYRHDFGRMVGGIEASSDGGKLQLGVDLNRVLPYGFVGTGGTYGAGVDIAIGKRFLLGVQRTEGDGEGSTAARIAIRF